MKVLRTVSASFLCLALLAVSSASGAQQISLSTESAPSSRSNVPPADGGDASNGDPFDEAGGPRVRLAVGEFDPLRKLAPFDVADAARVSSYPADGTGYYLVQFEGPVGRSDVDALTAAGATVFDYVPDFTFLVKMDDAIRAAVDDMARVRWTGVYQPAYRLSRDMLARAQNDDQDAALSPSGADGAITESEALQSDEPVQLIVTVFRGEALSPIIAAVEGMGGDVLDQSQTKWKSKLKVSIDPSQLTEVAAISGVRWIEEAPDWELFNNEAADIMGVREIWNTHGLYGDGQTVAVCDTGLDQGSTSPGSLHDDFEDGSGSSRVVLIEDLVGDGPDDVNSGHGTHVAGSVLGNGDLSGASPSSHSYPSTAYVGVAPEANLIFQAVEDNTEGTLAGIPIDLNHLFAAAASGGASIHTNSWGSSVSGMYTNSSEDVDEYVWDHKDFTVLFAAANQGVDSDADGVVDLYSMGSPATAKNCVTVGATENNRPPGSTPTPGYNTSWGTGSWAVPYPADPVSSDHVSDDPEGMAAFSSRGPALDGRYKPDIVAPGTNIASVRSSAASSTGWGAIDSSYMFNGGTSMATPLAAGAAALVRQYYTDLESITPSAALIKATMVNGATDVDPGQYGTGADREIPGSRPTNVAGWGRVDVEESVLPAPTRVMTYSDAAAGLDVGETDTYRYVVDDSGEPFRVTLAWSDYPGSPVAAGGLVNDLDLTVTGPGGTTYYPNNASQRGVSEHLAYDDGMPNGGLKADSGFLVSVRFTPSRYPARLQTGLFYVGSDSGSYPKTFDWYVHDGSAGSGPTSVLASGSTTIRQPGWHAVDLSGEGVAVSSGDFFLGIEMPDADLAWLYDDTNPDGRSWYYDSGTWSEYPPADFMFNAIVKSADVSTNQDRVNNLVGIDIESPPLGEYVVAVSGYNVPFGPQPYALVTSGAVASAAPSGPVVTSITPSSGVNTGTVHITDLSGSGFQSGATVKLTKSGEDDIEASGETVVSPSQITCDVDLTGATTGAWDVVVTNPDAQSDRLSGGFTVNADPSAPSVTSITPSTGVNTGTVQILDLSGSGFQSGATVKLTKSGESAINATSVAVIDPSWIACELDLTGATAGPWHVVVTNPDSLSGVLTEGFTVTTSADGSRTIYLPLALKRYPPYPDTPMLHAINNSDGNGSYTVSWSSAYLADTYTLQEDDNQHFSSPTPVYAGSGTSTFLSGRAPGTYYYRVKATNSWQGRQLDSRWSPSRIARVLPPTTFYPAADTTIMRGTPDMNWGNMASMRLGYDYGGCDDSVNGEVARGLVRFDLSSIPAGAEIVEARLHVYFLRSCYFQGHSQARTVTIYRTKSSWSEGTVTWQGRPGYAESYGWASVGVTESSLGWHSMDVTNLVRKWVDGTSSNFGLTIRAPEGSGDDFIRFGVVASESSGTAYDPYLEVEYAGTHSSGEVRPARAERPALSADDVGFQDALDVAPPLLESGPERTLEGKTLFYRSRDLDQSD
jgi:hypothetical protein